MKHKWIMFAIVFLFMSTGVSGCGLASLNYSYNSQTAGVTDKQPAVLKVFSCNKFDDISMLFEAFKKSQPGVELKYEFQSTDQYFDVLRTKLVSGIGPDMFNINMDMTDQYEDAGFLEELTNEAFIGNLTDDAISRLSTKSGRIYGIPMGQELWGVFYNRDFFSYAGIKQPPETWNDFLDACSKLKNAGASPFCGGFGDNWILHRFEETFRTGIYPEDIISKQEDGYNYGTLKYSDAKGYRNMILERIAELREKGYFYEGSFKLNREGEIEAFSQGKFAMLIMGSTAARQIYDETAQINMGVFPLPGGDVPQAQKMLSSSGTTWFINKNSEPANKEKVKKFLAYLCTKKVSLEYCDRNLLFSDIRGVTESVNNPLYQSVAQDYLKHKSNLFKIKPLISKTEDFKSANEAYYNGILKVAHNNWSINKVAADCDMAYKR